jgi:hypothetical protein
MTTMKGSKEELDRLPEGLRSLLERELEAGNEIVEIGHGFPAPPAGLYVKLARPVTTRPHESPDGVEFYDRNTPYCSGEFNDPKRFFFVLEPPRPAPPEPDMDAIREAHASGPDVMPDAKDEDIHRRPKILWPVSYGAWSSTTRNGMTGSGTIWRRSRRPHRRNGRRSRTF